MSETVFNIIKLLINNTKSYDGYGEGYNLYKKEDFKWHCDEKLNTNFATKYLKFIDDNFNSQLKNFNRNENIELDIEAIIPNPKTLEEKKMFCFLTKKCYYYSYQDYEYLQFYIPHIDYYTEGVIFCNEKNNNFIVIGSLGSHGFYFTNEVEYNNSDGSSPPLFINSDNKVETINHHYKYFKKLLNDECH